MNPERNRDSLFADLARAENQGDTRTAVYLRAEIRDLTPDPPRPVLPRLAKRVVGLRGPFPPPVRDPS